MGGGSSKPQLSTFAKSIQRIPGLRAAEQEAQKAAQEAQKAAQEATGELSGAA